VTNPSDTWNLVRLLADVERTQLSADREATLREAVKACRALESALQEALGAEPLRGLPNLGSSMASRGNRPRYLHRVRTNAARQLSGREELCLNARGQLVMADAFRERPVVDDELMATDAASLVQVLMIVLGGHLDATEQTSATYDEMRALAQRIVKLVKED